MRCAAGNACQNDGRVVRIGARIFGIHDEEYCSLACMDGRRELKARLVDAYGGGDVGENLAECEIRYQSAECAHLFCSEPAYQDGGVQASGVPFCPNHSYLAHGYGDAQEAADMASDHLARAKRHIEWARRWAYTGLIALGLAALTYAATIYKVAERL